MVTIRDGHGRREKNTGVLVNNQENSKHLQGRWRPEHDFVRGKEQTLEFSERSNDDLSFCKLTDYSSSWSCFVGTFRRLVSCLFVTQEISRGRRGSVNANDLESSNRVQKLQSQKESQQRRQQRSQRGHDGSRWKVGMKECPQSTNKHARAPCLILSKRVSEKYLTFCFITPQI